MGEQAIEVSVRRLPVIDMVFRGRLTIPEYKAALDEVARIVKQQSSPVVLLLDMLQFNPLSISAQMRRDGAAVWHENRELYLRTIVAEARLVAHPLVRGVLTAFDWLTAAGKWPCRQFAEAREAEAWLFDELRKRSQR